MRAAPASLVALFVSVQAFAQVPEALTEARKKAVEELTAQKTLMAQGGYKAEMEDCDSIIRKLLEPEKMMAEKGSSSVNPGEEKLNEMMKTWSELGTRLAAVYQEATGSLDGKWKDEAEMFAGWFESWPLVYEGTSHLNRRRRFCKLTPVMCDWSGSWPGYLHGRYLKINADHPSTQGLGAHNEDSKLPGATNEGAMAAGGILGGGGGAYVMDSWLGSEYHREPVFSSNCSRILFGGIKDGWWSCRNGTGGSGRALGDVITFPGDGDTDIHTYFGGEGPNPLAPFGMSTSGTFVVVNFLRGKPKKPVPVLKDPDGNTVEIIVINKNNPISFVAKKALKGESKYTVEIVGLDGKFSFSFTTAKAPEWGGGGKRGDPPEEK